MEYQDEYIPTDTQWSQQELCNMTAQQYFGMPCIDNILPPPNYMWQSHLSPANNSPTANMNDIQPPCDHYMMQSTQPLQLDHISTYYPFHINTASDNPLDHNLSYPAWMLADPNSSLIYLHTIIGPVIPVAETSWGCSSIVFYVHLYYKYIHLGAVAHSSAPLPHLQLHNYEAADNDVLLDNGRAERQRQTHMLRYRVQ